MSKPLATLETTFQGKWAFGVQEPGSLPSLRRRALREACGEETDGTAAAWITLPSRQRDLGDAILARLVEEERDVLEKDETVEVFFSGFRPNLLTDAGMDYLAGTATSLEVFSSAKLGTGTTPTVYDSGAITASASGTAVTASSSFFTAGMVGMIIKWDSGEEAYISGVTDGTNAVLGSSVTASGLFAVHAVNRTALAAPSVSQTTRASDAWTYPATGTWTRTMGWVFAIETANKNYTEGGIFCNWDGSGYNTALSLFLLTGGTVTILVGQQAKLYYAFSASVTPTAITATWPMSEYDTTDAQGWDSTSGQHLVIGLRSLHGLSAHHSASLLPSIDPGSDRGYISSTSSLLTYGDDTNVAVTGAIGSYVTGSKSAYVSKTFYRDASYTFPSTHSNTTSIRSFMLAEYFGNVAWQFLFDTVKGKTSNQQLTLTIRRALSRVLVNP